MSEIAIRLDKYSDIEVSIPTDEVRYYYGFVGYSIASTPSTYLYFLIDMEAVEDMQDAKDSVKAWLGHWAEWEIEIKGDKIPLTGSQLNAISRIGNHLMRICIILREGFRGK